MLTLILRKWELKIFLATSKKRREGRRDGLQIIFEMLLAIKIQTVY